MITVEAPAKVNLTLEVLGRRPDGYHEIASVMQTIDLCDTLVLEPAESVTLECDRAELQSPDNLALRAAIMLRKETGCRMGAHIRLQKRIPVAAGLGGGSSDAAATLAGLSRLWELGLPTERLEDMAARLGSDVPFFLHGGTAMVHGRGEHVRRLPPADIRWMVVLAPRIDVSNKTARVYQEVEEASFTRGALTRKLEARIRGGGDVPPQFLFNALESAAYSVFPGLEQYRETFHSLGAREIHLAGSGPSLFAPVARKEMGTALHLLLKHRYGWDAYHGSPWEPASVEAP